MTSLKARMHTADHLLLAVLRRQFPGVKTTTAEFRTDCIRTGFKIGRRLSAAEIGEIEVEVNKQINRNLAVVIKDRPRLEAEKIVDLAWVPQDAVVIRVVHIGRFSREACVGPHVGNTEEIGRFKVARFKSTNQELTIYATVEDKVTSKVVKRKIMPKEKNSKKLINPQPLKGFRDIFAEDVVIRDYVINTFKTVFERYGYEPLETPALEPAEMFIRELGDEAQKLFFRFTDPGGRDVMLKYEVMISMCRAVAANIDKIPFPYKRYQIQRCWRTEKPQKGRYREFTQCDADTIGSDSVVADAEFIQMGIEVLKTLGFTKFRANISNRKLLNGLIQFADGTEENFIPICLSLDKLPKIGKDKVKKELLEKRGVAAEVADRLLELVTLSGSTDKLLREFWVRLQKIPVAAEGLNELQTIFDYLKESEVDSQNYAFAPYIARGLAYYTGPIWEFEITEGGVGSVAGCGRYDNVIGRFVGRKIPATGGSFGIERIIEVMKDRQMLNLSPTPTQVLVTVFDQESFVPSLKLANRLREKGIPTLLFPEAARLPKQIKYADRKGIPYIAILGPKEIKENKITIKKLATGKQETLSLTQAIKQLAGDGNRSRISR